MGEMGRYCKAYPIASFRAFPGWTEASEHARAPLTGDSFLYLQENFVVTDGIFKDEHIVYDRVTPDWERFCKEELAFSVPAWALDSAEPV